MKAIIIKLLSSRIKEEIPTDRIRRVAQVVTLFLTPNLYPQMIKEVLEGGHKEYWAKPDKPLIFEHNYSTLECSRPRNKPLPKGYTSGQNPSFLLRVRYIFWKYLLCVF